MEETIKQHDQRIIALEKSHVQMRSDMRDAETRREMIDLRFNQINGRLDKLDVNTNKIVWLVFGGIVSGIVAFIVGGGLSVGA